LLVLEEGALENYIRFPELEKGALDVVKERAHGHRAIIGVA
jgi:hypothetical protein